MPVSSLAGHDIASLWRHYIPLARADILICSVVINMLGLALPMLTLQVYDRILPNNAIETFSYLLSGLIIVLVIETLLKVLRAWLAGWAGARYEHWAGMLALNRLLASELEAVEATPAGVHLDRLAGVDAIRDFYASQASLAIVDIPFVTLFLGLLIYIGGWIVLVPIVILFIAAWLALWLGRGLREAIEQRGVWDDRRYNFVIETLRGIHTIKGVSMEPLMQRRYERLMRSNAEKGHQVALLASVSQAVAGITNHITMAAVAGFGAYLVVEGTLSIGALAACILLSGRTIQPVLRSLALWTRYQSIMVAEQKIIELQELPSEASGGTRSEQLNLIELVDADFRFNTVMPKVFEGLNFNINIGETIGIQGENGSGKSAFLHLLMGRLKLENGSLYYNGLEAEVHKLSHAKQQFAYLSQRPVLMNGTVLENLTFFRSDEYIDIALDFAARLGLDEVFARMPDGYDTIIGDASANSLPGGVAQRVAIARALAMRPRFILFDEANSALDYEGEILLKQLLQEIQKDVGVILVTYRPSLMALASRVYKLEDKKLILKKEEQPAGSPPLVMSGLKAENKNA